MKHIDRQSKAKKEKFIEIQVWPYCNGLSRDISDTQLGSSKWWKNEKKMKIRKPLYSHFDFNQNPIHFGLWRPIHSIKKIPAVAIDATNKSWDLVKLIKNHKNFVHCTYTKVSVVFISKKDFVFIFLIFDFEEKVFVFGKLHRQSIIFILS